MLILNSLERIIRTSQTLLRSKFSSADTEVAKTNERKFTDTPGPPLIICSHPTNELMNQ